MPLFLVERDGTRIAELDATAGDPSWTLNGAGQLEFDIDPGTPSDRTPDVWLDLWDDRWKPTGPSRLAGFRLGGGVEVQLWEDGQLLWWGFPAGMPQVASSGPVRISCLSLEGHLASRRVVADLRYDQIDQLIIGQRLVEHAQDDAVQAGHADLNIDIATFPPSGRLRDRSYPADERSAISDLLDNLTAVRDGFDWSIETFPDGRREWTPWYPRRGTLRDHLTWQPEGPNRGIVSWSGSVDGQTVNDAHVSGTADEEDGEADGPAKPWGRFFDPLAAERDGLRSLVRSGADGTIDQATLDDAAARIVTEQRDPRPELTLMVEPTDVVDPKTIRPGDRFALDVRRGWLAFDGEWRAVEVAWRRSRRLAEVKVVPHHA